MNYYKAIFFFYLLFLYIPVISKAQSISGTVTGCADKQPLAGVTVKINGTNAGGTTDSDGKYMISGNMISRKNKYTLEFSFIGMKTVRKDVKISPESATATLNLCMENAASELEEVVVIAKSKVQTVRESAYNVVAIDAKALQNTTLDLAHAMEKVSGVKIRESSG
jgi:hypothetical protein